MLPEHRYILGALVNQQHQHRRLGVILRDHIGEVLQNLRLASIRGAQQQTALTKADGRDQVGNTHSVAALTVVALQVDTAAGIDRRQFLKGRTNAHLIRHITVDAGDVQHRGILIALALRTGLSHNQVAGAQSKAANLRHGDINILAGWQIILRTEKAIAIGMDFQNALTIAALARRQHLRHSGIGRSQLFIIIAGIRTTAGIWPRAITTLAIAGAWRIVPTPFAVGGTPLGLIPAGAVAIAARRRTVAARLISVTARRVVAKAAALLAVTAGLIAIGARLLSVRGTVLLRRARRCGLRRRIHRIRAETRRIIRRTNRVHPHGIVIHRRALTSCGAARLPCGTRTVGRRLISRLGAVTRCRVMPSGLKLWLCALCGLRRILLYCRGILRCRLRFLIVRLSLGRLHRHILRSGGDFSLQRRAQLLNDALLGQTRAEPNILLFRQLSQLNHRHQ